MDEMRRFGVYPYPDRDEYPVAEADTEDAALAAVRQLREDGDDRVLMPYDHETGYWSTRAPWTCPDCGGSTGPSGGRCGVCRLDHAEGRPVGSTAADDRAEIAAYHDDVERGSAETWL